MTVYCKIVEVSIEDECIYIEITEDELLRTES